MWKTILYTGNVDTCTSLYREDNVDTSIYQETYCPGNVDTSLNRDDNVDTSKYWDTGCLENVDTFLYSDGNVDTSIHVY